MNKVVYVIAALTALGIMATVSSAIQATHSAMAVCSAGGRCTGPGGSSGTAGTIGPCVNGHRNITSSDGRNLTQNC
jgi:hypothetical protein